MKKLGCAKCGGTKKMKLGGTNNVNISKPGAGFAKETKGDTNQKMGIYGIAQTGPTGPNNSGIATMKKGGTAKVHPLTAFRKFNDDRNKKLAKAQLGISTGQKFPARDTSAMKKFDDKRLTDIQSLQAKQTAESNLKSAMKAQMDKSNQDNVNRQKTAALNTTLKGYTRNPTTGKMMLTKKNGGAVKSKKK